MTIYQQLSEIELINVIIRGKVSVYEILIKRYSACLYKIGISYGFHQEDTEYLMQEAFISAFKNLSKLENKEHFKTWLIKIMLNECYKKNHKLSSIKEVIVDPSFLGKN